MNTHLFVRALAAAAVCLAALAFGATPSAATEPLTVSHPGDGYATINDAIAAAGCGGTVLLAAGIYNERISAPCSLHLFGAGEDQTIIDGSGLNDPSAFSVLILLGHLPTAVFPLTGDYEVAYLTLQSGPDAPPIGFLASWTQAATLHDLRVLGFETNGVALSLDTTIHDVYVQGIPDAPLKGFSQCIRISANRFRRALPQGHMTGHDIHNNVVEDCFVGINLIVTAQAAIHDNITRRTFVGINLNEDSEVDVHHNLVTYSDVPSDEGVPAAGMDLANLSNSLIHHNTYCHNTIAIRYSFSLVPDVAGFPPSSNNTIHHNTFSQNGQDIVLDDPDLGPGNTEFKNVTDLGLGC